MTGSHYLHPTTTRHTLPRVEEVSQAAVIPSYMTIFTDNNGHEFGIAHYGGDIFQSKLPPHLALLERFHATADEALEYMSDFACMSLLMFVCEHVRQKEALAPMVPHMVC